MRVPARDLMTSVLVCATLAVSAQAWVWRTLMRCSPCRAVAITQRTVMLASVISLCSVFSAPAQSASPPPPPKLATKAHVLVDHHTGQVLSSFEDKPGTLVVDEDEIVEKQVVSGITYAKNEAQITIVGIVNEPGIASNIFLLLADGNINVDMIIQSETEDGRKTDLTFTVTDIDLDKTISILEGAEDIHFDSLLTDSNVVKISVIGVGMRSHAGVASTMFKTLADKGINIQVISTSEIKISVLINSEYTELAVRALHTAYGLDAE
jgi:aspartokinase